MEPVPSVDAPLPKRRIWPWFVVLAVIVVAGAAVAWWQITAPYPLRVLVAVDVDGQWWEGSKAAAIAVDEVAAALAERGFDPVRAGDPETMRVLEESDSLEEAARKLKAAFIVEARVAPEVLELPFPIQAIEARFDAPVIVRHRGSQVGEGKLSGWAVAPKKEVALALLARAVAEQAIDAALPLLVNHESIQDVFAGSDAKLVDRLAPAKRFVEARAKALETAAGEYAGLDKQRAGEKGVTLVSEIDADERLCGVTDRGILVANAPVTPHYGGAADKLERRIELERIGWRKDSAIDVLWRGYSAFTYPSTAKDRIVFIEDLYGRGRALSFIDEKGKTRRLRVEPERKLSQPRISPDGKMVALIDKACSGCPEELSVLDLGEKASERFRIDASAYVAFGAFRWLDARRLLVLYTPSRSEEGEEAPRLALWAVDVFGGERVSLMVPEDGAMLVDPATSPDGKRIAASHYNADAIVTMDLAAKEVRSHPVGGKATVLSFSNDGKRIVFELEDREQLDIAMLDIASSKVTRLTKNDSPDRYPVFSPDGKRVYFEARNTDPVFGRKRAVSRVAWVAVP